MLPEHLAHFKNLVVIPTPADFTRNFYIEVKCIVHANHQYKNTELQNNLTQMLIQQQHIDTNDKEEIFKAQTAVRRTTEELGVAHCQHKNCTTPHNLHYPTVVIEFKNADLLTEQEIENVIEHWHTTNEHLFIKYNLFGAMVYGKMYNKIQNENLSFVSVN